MIAGTPTLAGNFRFTIRVQDTSIPAMPSTATKAFEPQIAAPPITILTGNPLPATEPGAPYNLIFTAQGGATPYGWSLQSGSLPPGLSLSNDGGLSGETGVEGSYTFVVRVRDAANLTTSKSFSLSVARVRRPFEIGTTSLPGGTTGVFYGATVFARGGSEPYAYSMNGLPPGLQSNSRGGIDGVPTRAGSYSVRVSATDADRDQASATFTVTIKAGQVEIFTTNVPEGRVDSRYSTVFGAQGGVPTYTWAFGGGTLPSGLALNSSGELSGTPTELGAFTFNVQVTDQEKQSTTKSFTLTVRPAVLTITTDTLPNGASGSPYSNLFTAAGGTKPYNWSLSGGVPPGLSVNADSGIVSGTPTTPGTYTFTALVSDGGSQPANKSFAITITPSIVITNASPLPTLTAGLPGNISFSATGGTRPYVWSVGSGSIPAGMTFASGQLTGTPTTPESSSFTVQVTDSNRASTSKSFTIEVRPGVTITTESLPNGVAGTAYAASATAAGGVPPYRWTANGTLPPGISVDDGGVFSGRPTTQGTYTFTLEVSDSAQPVAGTSSRSFTIAVALPPVTTVNITGLSDNPAPAQQVRINLNIGAPFPVDVTGAITLTFAPDAANNADDPTIQFSNGGRTRPSPSRWVKLKLYFRTTDLFLQTGTTAGTITLTTSLTAAGNPVACSCSLTQTIRIARTAPVISSVRVSRTASGFTIVIIGYSSPREITRAVFRFSGASSLQTNEVTLPATDLFNQYYRGNSLVGGQFVLTDPFAIQGAAGDVTSVTIVLSNSAGDSQPSTATF